MSASLTARPAGDAAAAVAAAARHVAKVSGERWPFGMTLAVAAEYTSFSIAHFNKMVEGGRMPAPRREGARLVWLRDELEAALRALPQDGDDGGANEWDATL